jgi:uncharacterized protein YndB with AHSA1/START domain
MSNLMQHGYLILADISGYTSYVAATELEHAQAILGELLEVIIGRTTSLMTLSKLEGDAVFTYAPESRVERGETLLELVESTYVAFRDKVDVMRRHTTCECNACRAIPTLDLKFIVHHGDYIVQHVAGISELVGSDVNLVHRLLKNHVSEQTGWRGYLLCTQASLAHMGLPPEGMHDMTESYEHLGDVLTHSIDLQKRYKEITDARRIVVSPAEAACVFEEDFDAPPPVVWEWLNDPVNRTRWGGNNHWSAVTRPGGRTTVGASNHCAHGKSINVETILDWRPFQYVTSEQDAQGNIMRQTVTFEPTPDGKGTHVAFYLTPLKMPMPRAIARPVFNFMMFKLFKYPQAVENAARMLADSQKAREHDESSETNAAHDHAAH